MNDHAAATHENLASRIARWCSTTWGAIEDAKILASLDDETVKILAHDNALSRDELISLVRRGPHAADEMIALMRLLEIDPREARVAEPLQFREMHIACSICEEKPRCRREVADGTAAADFSTYCVNAEQLTAMRARTDLRADR